MSVQTPRPVRAPRRRHPSIEFRASPLRSASRASPTTPAPNHSTKPTAVLGHWWPRLTHQDRRNSSELRKKIKVILGESLDEDSNPPAYADRGHCCTCRGRYDAGFVTAPTGPGKGVIFEAMHFIFIRRSVTIVVSPLTALSNHQAANLNRKGKNAIVVSEETWRNGELYRQLDDPNHKISFILIVYAG